MPPLCTYLLELFVLKCGPTAVFDFLSANFAYLSCTHEHRTLMLHAAFSVLELFVHCTFTRAFAVYHHYFRQALRIGLEIMIQCIEDASFDDARLN
jgi:hypothetical protein